MENSKKGFTLLELLTVMALLVILSFSVVYSLQDGSRKGLKQTQQLVEKMLQNARATAILKNTECRLLVLDDDNSIENEKMLTLAIKDADGSWKGTSAFVALAKEVSLSFDECSKMSFGAIDEKDCLWDYISFNNRGLCGNSIYLGFSDDDSMKITFTMTAAGGIEVE